MVNARAVRGIRASFDNRNLKSSALRARPGRPVELERIAQRCCTLFRCVHDWLQVYEPAGARALKGPSTGIRLRLGRQVRKQLSQLSHVAIVYAGAVLQPVVASRSVAHVAVASGAAASKIKCHHCLMWCLSQCPPPLKRVQPRVKRKPSTAMYGSKTSVTPSGGQRMCTVSRLAFSAQCTTRSFGARSAASVAATHQFGIRRGRSHSLAGSSGSASALGCSKLDLY